jgi:hypothetical protein
VDLTQDWFHATAGHWTEDMREDALEPAQLNNPDLKVWEQLSQLMDVTAPSTACGQSQ